MAKLPDETRDLGLRKPVDEPLPAKRGPANAISKSEPEEMTAADRLVNASDLGLPTPDHYNGVTTLSSVRAAIEKNTIQLSLITNANNVSAAARNLGVSRVTLYRLMDKFDINVERKAPPPPFAVPSAGGA